MSKIVVPGAVFSNSQVPGATPRALRARGRRLAAVLAMTASAVLTLTGCFEIVEISDAAEDASQPPAVVATDASVTSGTAAEVLDSLAVKGRSPKTGYDRKEKFGTAWLDVDRNGCDTRNDMLQRDLDDAVLEGRCKVLSGTLVDAFTGTQIDFVRGEKTSTLVQIDHIVALSDAWQKGAQQLTQAQRVTLANDPLNLLAVDGPSNSAKGDSDAASWLPQNTGFRCEYVARQISVKATYGLWVTPAEKDAMHRVLNTCPGQPAYTSEFTPGTEVAGAPAAAAPELRFENCAAARAAGLTPLYRGSPGYGAHLDGDGDGVACE